MNISILAFLYSIFLTVYVNKTVKKDAPLTSIEKVQVTFTVFFNPILAGLVYYYGWKNKFITKAKEANKLSFIFFGIQLLFAFVLAYALIKKQL